MSSTLDVDTCLTWIPPNLLSQIWRVGERDLLKRPLDTSGFTLNLADDDDARRALQDAHSNLETVGSRIASLIAEGVDVQVDFGLFVTSVVPQTLVIPQTLLERLVDLGVGVVVSAYPCSDED